MTRLCVAIFVDNPEQAKRDVAAAIEAGAAMVELRLDSVTDPVVAREIIGSFDHPFVLTCRPVWEGGRSEAADEARLRLLAELAPTDESTFIDVELVTLQRAGKAGILNRLIVSSHD